MHAAEHHGATAVGVTVSHRQVELAAKRVAEAGLADQVQIRIQDYRLVNDGPFDAISSIGMFEHVGEARLAEYFGRLYDLLPPGGRLLNHGISRPPDPTASRRRDRSHGFIDRYVFPDGELHEVGRVVSIVPASRLRGPPRRVVARALRQDAAALGREPRGPLGRGGRARRRRPAPASGGCTWRGPPSTSRPDRTQIHQVLAVKPDEAVRACRCGPTWDDAAVDAAWITSGGCRARATSPSSTGPDRSRSRTAAARAKCPRTRCRRSSTRSGSATATSRPTCTSLPTACCSPFTTTSSTASPTATGVIDELPWSVVREAKVDGREPIPLLDDLFGAWPDVRVNIDPKHDGAVDAARPHAARRAMRSTACASAPSATNGSTASVRCCPACAPRSVRSASLQARPRRAGRPIDPAARTLRAGADPLSRHRDRHACIRRGRARPRHGRCTCGRSTTRHEMERLLDLGVDGIMTDRPEGVAGGARTQASSGRRERPADPARLPAPRATVVPRTRRCRRRRCSRTPTAEFAQRCDRLASMLVTRRRSPARRSGRVAVRQHARDARGVLRRAARRCRAAAAEHPPRQRGDPLRARRQRGGRVVPASRPARPRTSGATGGARRRVRGNAGGAAVRAVDACRTSTRTRRPSCSTRPARPARRRVRCCRTAACISTRCTTR